MSRLEELYPEQGLSGIAAAPNDDLDNVNALADDDEVEDDLDDEDADELDDEDEDDLDDEEDGDLDEEDDELDDEDLDEEDVDEDEA